jgi:hypothetical protein
MDENVVFLHGPLDLHAVNGEGALTAKRPVEHGVEKVRHPMEGGFSLRIKRDRRRGPNGFAGTERRQRNVRVRG